MKLLVKNPNGTQTVIDTNAREVAHVPAKPGATYHPVSSKTGKTAITTVVKRVDDDLVIHDADDGTVQIDGFFDECKPTDRCWAVLDTPDTVAGAGNTASQVTITQDSHALGALNGGTSGGMGAGQELSFLSSTSSYAAAGSEGFGLLGWLGVGAGALALGNAAVGGGGGGQPLRSTSRSLSVDDDGRQGPLTVRGEVAAGPMQSGTVIVSVYDKDGNLLGQAPVHNNVGEYEIVIPGMGNYTGPLLLVARDADSAMADNYIDEVTHQLTNLGDSLAAAGVATSPTAIINITPITHFAVMKMGLDVNSPGAVLKPADAATITTVNRAVGEFFGVADILGPVVTINETDFRSASAAAQAYGVALARLSEIDAQTGSIAASLRWIADNTLMDGGSITTSQAQLRILDTDLTVPRIQDIEAARMAANDLSLSLINLRNYHNTRVVIPLPVNAVVGDVVHVTLMGTAGNAEVAPYAISAQDIARGYAAVPVSAADVVTVGTGNVVPHAYVTDAHGDNSSPDFAGVSFFADVTTHVPLITLVNGGQNVGAGTADVPVVVTYQDMAAGDVVQIWANGQPIGQPHTVTAAEAAAGRMVIDLPRAGLGADGDKQLTASQTDLGGNVTVGPVFDLYLDSLVPAPVLSLAPGHDNVLNAADTGIAVQLRDTGLKAGDRVQLSVSGASVGTVYTVTASDVSAGVLSFTLPKSAFGADGLKNIAATVTDAAGNSGTSNPLPVTVDGTPPAPTVTIRAGEDAILNAAETVVHLEVREPRLAAGDVITLAVAGQPLGTPYVVTPNDVAQGYVSVPVQKADLGGDGTKPVTVTVTDLAGNPGTSAPLPLVVDSVATVPTLSIAAGEDKYLNANEPTVHLDVSFAGMAAGNTIQLRMNGADFGNAYIVTSADVAAGHATLTVNRADLAVQGSQFAAVVASGAAGNAGSSNAIELIVDTEAPTPHLAIATGEDALLGAAESVLHLQVTDSSLTPGDVIQLKLAGVNLYAPYTVTSADVQSGSVTLTVNRADLGADGVKSLSVTNTDPAGNAGSSNAVSVTLDSVVPAPSISIAPGENNLVNGAESVLNVRLSDPHLTAGDVVQLSSGGVALGAAYTLTAADVSNGYATLSIPRSSLGSDGLKDIAATVTDPAGNSGSSNHLSVTLDTVPPAPVLSLAPGETTYVNAAQNATQVAVTYAGLTAGDSVQLSLAGSPLGAAHVVTAADVTAGQVIFTVAKSSLGSDGLKALTVTATDAAGNSGSSNTLDITLDTTPPAPTLYVDSLTDLILNAVETQQDFRVSYSGLAAGDRVQLQNSGIAVGPVFTVTATDVANGYVNVTLDKSLMGADGNKDITAIATDMAGNSGISSTVRLLLDSVAAVPMLSVHAGEDATLGANESTLHLDVSFAGMSAGNTIQLKLGGQDFGAPYTVTGADVAAGFATLDVSRASLGADGVKNLAAVATGTAGNAGVSNILNVTVDTTAPVPMLGIVAGEDALLGANESVLHLQASYTGLAVGDQLQLHLGGSPIGPVYTVTLADVLAGHATLSVQRTDLGADGGKQLTVTATDVAGNSGTSAQLAVVVDTTAPVATLSIHSGEDNVVNASESGVSMDITYAGMTAGDVVQLRVDGQPNGLPHVVTPSEAANGTVTLPVNRLLLGLDGSKNVTADVTDGAGNTGSSNTVAITLDTTAPLLQFSDHTGLHVAGAGQALLGAGDPGVVLVDGGSLVSDNQVAQVRVSLHGFVDGAAEQLTFGGTVLAADGSNTPATMTAGGKVWNVAYANGGYTFTAAGGSASPAEVAALMQLTYNDLAPMATNGQRVVEYSATDIHGNTGNTVVASVLVAVTAPAITTAITALGQDTGIAGDFVTTVPGQTITGTFSGLMGVGDKIQVSVDGNTWVDATVTGPGTWSVDNITLQPGTNTLYARAIDLAGNPTVPSTHAYTLESGSIATTASITGAMDDAALNGSAVGAIANGTSTDDATPTLNGTVSAVLSAGQVVAVYDNGLRIGVATVNGTAWSYTATAGSTGTHSYTAQVESPASGVQGAPSAAFVIHEQSVTLVATDDVGALQGQIAAGGVTDDSHPHLSGTLGGATLGTNEVVAIYDGSTYVGNATVSGTSWSYDFGAALTDGAHNLRAVIQTQGNTSLANAVVVSDLRNFTVDTAALAPTQTVSITSAADDVSLRGSTTVALASDNSTDDRDVTLAGTISAPLTANQIVAIYDNGQRVGEATVNGTAWTYATGNLTVGAHSFVAIAESAASGARGTASAAFVVREQSITVTSIEDNVGIDVGNLLNLSLTDDSTPTVKGTLGTTLGANEVVAVYDGNTLLGTAVVNGTAWSYTPATPLADGVHTLRVMVQDANGTAADGRVVSDSSTLTVLTLLSTPQQTVTITAAAENNAANGSMTGTFASGSSTDGTTPTLSGTLNAGLNLAEVVAVYDGSMRVGYASVNGTSWTYTTPTLSLGTHPLTARVENLVSGAQGPASNTYLVIEQSIAVTGLLDDVGSSQGQITAGSVTDDSRPVISGTLGSANLGTGEVVAIYDGSTKLGNATVTGNGWSFSVSNALTDGNHSLRAVIEDSNGNVHLATASTAFTVNTSNVVPTQTTTITGATENTGTLTGSFASGTSTDGRTPTLSGTISAQLDAGQAVALYDGSTRIGYATTSGTSWSYTTPTLADGSHSFTAVVENQATGARGTASAAFVVNEQSVTIDNLLGITGAVSVLVGGIANIVLGTNPDFTGSLGSATLGPNEVVAVYDGATKLGNATLNGNHWGFTPTSPLATGFHQISVVVQDASATSLSSARVSSSVSNLTVDLGLLVPTQLVNINWAIESNAANGSVTGAFASGTSTDATTPTIGGSVSASLTGAQVIAVYDGTTKLGNATVTGQSWSYTTPTLTTGTHNLTARVENPSTGSSGPTSGTFVVMQQSISGLTVTDDVGAIQGSVAPGGYTDDQRPTFSGTLGSAGLGLLETVAIYDTRNGVTTKLGDAVVNGTNWSFTPLFLFPMADGAHSVKAVIQPLLSLNDSGTVVSAPYNFTIDSSGTPLQFVSLNSVTDTLALGGSIIGSVLSGGTLDDTRPTLNGTLSAGLTGAQAVAIYDNNVKLGYANVDVSNPLKFSYTPGQDLSAGTHTLTARVENTATGAQGASIGTYVIVERPITLKVTDNVGALQGDVLSFDRAVTDDTSLLLSGSIGTPLLLNGLNIPLERVRVYDNGNFVGNATVNGTEWSYNLTGLTAGSHHDISVRVTDLTGLIYTVATGGSFDVASSDLATTPSTQYTSNGSVAAFTLGGHANLLDLTLVGGAAQPNIDVVKAGSDNTVKLALADVLQGGTNVFNSSSGWTGVNGTGKHQMVIEGSTGSTVNVTDGSWSSVGSTSYNGNTYTVYENSTHLAQLLIDTHLTRSGTVGG